jgi:hypothetical protein
MTLDEAIKIAGEALLLMTLCKPEQRDSDEAAAVLSRFAEELPTARVDIRDILEWGAATSSDRDLHRKLLLDVLDILTPESR